MCVPDGETNANLRVLKYGKWERGKSFIFFACLGQTKKSAFKQQSLDYPIPKHYLDRLYLDNPIHIQRNAYSVEKQNGLEVSWSGQPIQLKTKPFLCEATNEGGMSKISEGINDFCQLFYSTCC